MYSSTDWCELKVKRGKEIEFFDWLKRNEDWKEAIEVLNGEVEIQVSWKIISYWYDSFLDELEQLAEYITGKWILLYETGESKAIITFTEDDEVKIEVGEMDYHKIDIDDLRKENMKMERSD